MASLNISLSDELKKYVEAQIKGGSYGNVSEYFRSLIRDHQKRAAQERLELLLLEGMESGSAGKMTKSDWSELRQVALKRVKGRGGETGARKTGSK
jgi:antitoxin ParD1/3/4